MIKLRNMLITAIAIVGLTSQVSAFEGWSVGATYSTNDFSTSGSGSKDRTTSSGTAVSTMDTQSTSVTKDVDIASFFAEYTFAQGSSFGIEYIPGEGDLGTKTRTDTVSDANEVTDDSGDYTGKATLSDHYMMYAEPTFMMNDNFGVYLKAGYAKVTVETNEVSPAGNSTYGNQDVFGVATGFGAKFYMGNFFLKAEQLDVDYGEVSLLSSTGQQTISAEPEADRTNFSLGYNF